ncbi:MAG: hypothetical protein WC816_11105 [Sphingomonas sp.]
MRRSAIAFALLAPLVIGAVSDKNAIPDATPVGKPVSCIPLTSIDTTRVHGDWVIDFHMRDRKVFRNTLPAACPGLGFEERFGYQTSLSQLCSTDIITVLYTSPLQRGASCGLGEFQQVTLAAAH